MDKATFSPKDDPEFTMKEAQPSSWLLQYTRSLVRLLRAIVTEDGYVLSSEISEVYGQLLSRILQISEEIDTDVFAKGFLGIRAIAERLPEEFSFETASKAFLKSYRADTDALDLCCNDLEEAVGHLLFTLPANSLEELGQATVAIARIEEARGVSHEILRGKAAGAIGSITIASVEASLTFGYVQDAQLRKLLREYLRETLGAFSNHAHRSCVVLQNAILEAVIVSALESRREDAALAFVELNKYRSPDRRPRGNPSDISRWEMPTLISIAKQLNILFTPNAENYCRDFNRYRNMIHIHNQQNAFLQVSEAECLLGFYVLRLVNSDISKHLGPLQTSDR